MTSSMTLGESILAAVRANPDLARLVGDRVYPVDLPDRAALPALVWQVVAEDPNTCHGEAVTEEDAFHDVQLTAVADDFDDIEAITSALKTFDGAQIFAGHPASYITKNDLPSTIPGRFARAHDFTF
jgi:hypothetical protein